MNSAISWLSSSGLSKCAECPHASRSSTCAAHCNVGPIQGAEQPAQVPGGTMQLAAPAQALSVSSQMGPVGQVGSLLSHGRCCTAAGTCAGLMSSPTCACGMASAKRWASEGGRILSCLPQTTSVRCRTLATCCERRKPPLRMKA